MSENVFDGQYSASQFSVSKKGFGGPGFVTVGRSREVVEYIEFADLAHAFSQVLRTCSNRKGHLLERGIADALSAALGGRCC